MKGSTELYRFYDEQESLLYVGISINAIMRMTQHRCASSWYEQATSITIARYKTREDALQAEKEAIKNEKPTHNIHHNNGSVIEQCVVEDEKPDWVTRPNGNTPDGRNTINRTVNYKPLYSAKEAGDTLSLTGDKVKKIRGLIESGNMDGVLIKEETRAVNVGGGETEMRTVRHYAVTGWQLIDFIERLQTGESTLR